MQLVLLSGGSGRRLWPLSNDARPKQFLKLLRNEQGERESMLQRVWRQLKASGLASSAHMVAGPSLVEPIQNQLGPDAPIIVEPDRRDTFPAVCLATTYLYSQKGVHPDDVLVVLPVDPYVETAFFHRLRDLEPLVRTGGFRLALIGARPTHPSEKYGYIVPAEAAVSREPMPVAFFKEKPPIKTAERLIRQGALWNCGVFAFQLRYVLSMLEQAGLPREYTALRAQYHRLPKTSFDYAVAEKETQMVVLPYDGPWKDLGTWNTLTEEMHTRQTGPGFIGDDCADTHLINELDLPVAILGLSRVVVAAGPDGILVADKEACARLKEALPEFARRPRYEERRWGSVRVLDHVQPDDGPEMLTRKMCIRAGENLSYHMHQQRTETWTIARGTGTLALHDDMRTVTAGDVVRIPPGTRHAIRADTDLDIIEVQTGHPLIIEDDVIRLATDWDDILRRCDTATRRH